MNAEVHKSLLSKHGGAFAMSTTEAVDQMVGYETLKRSSSRIAGKRESDANHVDKSGSFQLSDDDEPEQLDRFIFCQITAKNYNAGDEPAITIKYETIFCLQLI